MTVFTFLTLSDGIVYVPRLKKFRSVIGVDQSLLDVANWEVVPGGEMLTPQHKEKGRLGEKR